MVEKLKRVDKAATDVHAALQFKPDERAKAALEIGVGAAAILAALEAGKYDVRD